MLLTFRSRRSEATTRGRCPPAARGPRGLSGPEPDTRPLAEGAAGAGTVLARPALQAPQPGEREGRFSFPQVVFKTESFPTSRVLGCPFPSVSR